MSTQPAVLGDFEDWARQQREAARRVQETEQREVEPLRVKASKLVKSLEKARKRREEWQTRVDAEEAKLREANEAVARAEHVTEERKHDIQKQLMDKFMQAVEFVAPWAPDLIATDAFAAAAGGLPKRKAWPSGWIVDRRPGMTSKQIVSGVALLNQAWLASSSTSKRATVARDFAAPVDAIPRLIEPSMFEDTRAWFVRVTPGSSTWDALISHTGSRGLAAAIVDIYQIQNITQLERYQACLGTIQADMRRVGKFDVDLPSAAGRTPAASTSSDDSDGEEGVNRLKPNKPIVQVGETFPCFHGTRFSTLTSIASHGLDVQCAPTRTRSAFGIGAYVTPSCRTAYSYALNATPAGQKNMVYMVMARAATGLVELGSRDQHGPRVYPDDPLSVGTYQPSVTRYHSTADTSVANLKANSQYCLWKSEQTLPVAVFVIDVAKVQRPRPMYRMKTGPLQRQAMLPFVAPTALAPTAAASSGAAAQAPAPLAGAVVSKP
jgi:hypothetical protein